MAKLLYILFLRIYSLAASLISPFNDKAKKWIDGRKNILQTISLAVANDASKKIWVHCSSLGEFEQGKPVMEALKKNYPAFKLVLTFFSPSGYEVQKNFSGADYIFYMPIDGKQNAAAFFDIIQPSLIIFIKYEFWHFYLNEAKRRNICLLLVSGMFRKSQPFFQWYGSFHQQMLCCFTHIFVQAQQALELLHSIGVSNCSVSGDTRFDRVLEIAENFMPIPAVEEFCGNHITIVAGSTWLDDDEALDHYVNTHPEYRFIIAPHDISEDRLQECEKLYKHTLRFSQTTNDKLRTSHLTPHTSNTLLIDNIGMLKYLYKYGTICYVGGGFGGDGVHNVLEAAVYAKPVVFGPVYEKFIEASELIEAGGAASVGDAIELEAEFDELLNNKEECKVAGNTAGNYVKDKCGATKKVISFIQEKRLLTN